MKVSLVNQQPRDRDYEFNIELKCSKPLGDKVDAVECGRCTNLVNIDNYTGNRCLHIRIISVQF